MISKAKSTVGTFFAFGRRIVTIKYSKLSMGNSYD